MVIIIDLGLESDVALITPVSISFNLAQTVSAPAGHCGAIVDQICYHWLSSTEQSHHCSAAADIVSTFHPHETSAFTLKANCFRSQQCVISHRVHTRS